jgi:hypothetical protein
MSCGCASPVATGAAGSSFQHWTFRWYVSTTSPSWLRPVVCTWTTPRSAPSTSPDAQHQRLRLDGVADVHRHPEAHVDVLEVGAPFSETSSTLWLNTMFITSPGGRHEPLVTHRRARSGRSSTGGSW